MASLLKAGIYISRPSRLTGDTRTCDVDGQCDIAFLISAPLSLTHTFFYVPLTSSSPPSFIFLFVCSVALTHHCALSSISPSCIISLCLSFIHLSSRRVLMDSSGCSVRPIGLSGAASPFSAAAPASVLVCPHKHGDSCNHFTRSNNHYFV